MEGPVVFLHGKEVFLRPPELSDVPLLVRWVNDPEVRRFLARTLPYNSVMEEDWVKKCNTKDNVTLVICLKDEKPIGTMGVHGINWSQGFATTGALIGEKEYWGRGFGTDAKMALLNYIFNNLGIRKVCSEVIEFNERSLRYSLHCGYKIDGRLRKHLFRDGKFWDLYQLSVFRDEWLPIWEIWQKTGKLS